MWIHDVTRHTTWRVQPFQAILSSATCHQHDILRLLPTSQSVPLKLWNKTWRRVFASCQVRQGRTFSSASTATGRCHFNIKMRNRVELCGKWNIVTSINRQSSLLSYRLLFLNKTWITLTNSALLDLKLLLIFFFVQQRKKAKYKNDEINIKFKGVRVNSSSFEWYAWMSVYQSSSCSRWMINYFGYFFQFVKTFLREMLLAAIR